MTAFDFGILFENTLVQVLLVLGVAVLVQMLLRVIVYTIAGKMLATHKYESKVELRQRHKTLTAIFVTAAAVLIWIMAIIVILRIFKVDVAALATGAGLFGIIVGFGAQSAIKDYLAGVFIIIENQYRVGDIVSLEAAGKTTSGVVEDITIRITKLRDMDGNFHIVANGSIELVSNLSFEFAQVNIDLDVSYDTDVDKAIEVINIVGAAQLDDDTLKDNIIKPIAFLRVNDFRDSSIQLKCVGRVKPGMQWDIAGDYRLRIKKAFDVANIEIPFPQVTIHSDK